MRLFVLAMASLIFVGCASLERNPSAVAGQARGAQYLDDDSLRIINLTNVAVIDNENNSTFPFSVKPMPSTSDAIKQELLKQTGHDLLLSRVFEARSVSNFPAFKTAFIFVTKEILDADHANYRLNVVYVHKSGHTTVIRYKIVEANPRALSLTVGPSDELSHLTAKAETSFFPF